MPPSIPGIESEPFIPYLEREDFAPALESLVAPYIERMGFLPNALRLYAYRPEIAATLFRLNNDVMRDASSTLPPLLKRKVAVICSSINGCRYCTAHSCTVLKRSPSESPISSEGWDLSDEEVAGLVSGDLPPADDRERVTFAYARAASRNPGAVSRALLDDLTEHLTPEQIVELACVIGFWKFYNTVHDSLHIPIETDLLADGGYVDLATDKAYQGAGRDNNN